MPIPSLTVSTVVYSCTYTVYTAHGALLVYFRFGYSIACCTRGSVSPVTKRSLAANGLWETYLDNGLELCDQTVRTKAVKPYHGAWYAGLVQT